MAKKNTTPQTEEIQERIVEKRLEYAVHEFMMPYAESVILDRALPRVEDGLKPVQRRILYTMHELNLKPEGQYKKSARVVGDCLGKYHPHGDISVYDAMVNLAQDFKMRNPLVDGQGNFGSIDGDSAAAMRYTEVKMMPLAVEMLKDLEKNTIKWEKNFDDSLDEPSVLPAAFPNLLVNGATGIAIGLSTEIPPHNLTEVLDGTIALIDNPKIELKDLLKIIKGPDFPTAGYFVPGDSLEEIYSTGRGKIIMRAKVDIEVEGTGKQNIVITELPYGVNKSELQVKIKNLKEAYLNEKKDYESKQDKAGIKPPAKEKEVLEAIQAIVDESDRNGIRVVIKVKKGEDATQLLQYLYSKTDLQCNFNVNMFAIADGRPQKLGLIPLLNYYLAHRRTIVLNRSKYDLDVAQKRAHVLQGFVIILHDIDGVVALIKASSSRSDARDKLRAKYALSEKQADAILDLKLVNLTKLEISKIEKELADLDILIQKLTKIISNDKEQFAVVKAELLEMRKKYPSKRMTKILDSLDQLDRFEEVLTKKTSTKNGYLLRSITGEVKFLSPLLFSNASGTEPTCDQEVIAEHVEIKEGIQPLVFGSDGNCYKWDMENAHEVRLIDKGQIPAMMTPETTEDAKFIKILPVSEEDSGKELLFVTKNGMVKKSTVSECIVAKDVYQVISLKKGDELVDVEFVQPDSGLLLVTDDGMALNTDINEVSCTGRKTSGVIGMNVADGASVVYVRQISCDITHTIPGELAFVSNAGYAKRITASFVKFAKRGKSGNKIMDMVDGGKIVFAVHYLPGTKINFALKTKKGIELSSTGELLMDRTGEGKGKNFASSKGCLLASERL